MKKIECYDHKGAFTMYALYYGEKLRIGFVPPKFYKKIIENKGLLFWTFSFLRYETFWQLSILGVNIGKKYKYEKIQSNG